MKSNWMAWGLALLWALALPAAAQVALPDDLPPVPADKAQVVFLKPGGGLWAGLNVGIVSLEGDQRRLLGVLQEKSRLVVDLEPGQHRFMSYLQGLGHLRRLQHRNSAGPHGGPIEQQFAAGPAHRRRAAQGQVVEPA